MQPLVSVIIPCYMQTRFLPEAVESVLAQAYQRHEIIVVNDGSPDARALERAIAPFGDVIRYIKQDNRGLSGARNAGLEVAAGEYVVCLDADDRLLPNALAAGVDAHLAHPTCAFVWGFHRLIDANGDVLPRTPSTLEVGASFLELLRMNIVGPPVGVIFRHACLAEIGGFSTATDAAADYDAYLELARRHAFHCHWTLVAEYRRHDGNMSRDLPAMLRSVLRALDRQADWVRHDPELYRAWKTGRANAREAYDWDPRMRRLRQELVAGHWGAGSASGAALMARYPLRFWRRLSRRLWRSVAG